MQYDIQMVIIDYLQLMSAGGGGKGPGNREQEISTISRSIKEIAKELNIPIIALSQLSRSVETRGGDKRPMLSDLRESGAIEQDADIVGFLYRPEYYGLMQDEDGSSNQGVGEVIIAKHRNGALDSVRLRFVGQYARFENFEDVIENNQDFNPASLNAGLTASRDFDMPTRTITLGSNMNNIEDDFTQGDSTPF
jgi:replicative DNA helicase